MNTSLTLLALLLAQTSFALDEIQLARPVTGDRVNAFITGKTTGIVSEVLSFFEAAKAKKITDDSDCNVYSFRDARSAGEITDCSDGELMWAFEIPQSLLREVSISSKGYTLQFGGSGADKIYEGMLGLATLGKLKKAGSHLIDGEEVPYFQSGRILCEVQEIEGGTQNSPRIETLCTLKDSQ
jgi:hypothetical protein